MRRSVLRNYVIPNTVIFNYCLSFYTKPQAENVIVHTVVSYMYVCTILYTHMCIVYCTVQVCTRLKLTFYTYALPEM